MRFHATRVSASVAGDYYQVLLETGDGGDDFNPDALYCLIQRGFEFPDGGRVGIETHDLRYVGEFRVRRVKFSAERLSVELDRSDDNLIEVTFGRLSDAECRRVQRVLKIMIGRRLNP